MATTLYLLDTIPDTHLGTDNANLRGSFVGWVSRALGTARGSGVVASAATATVTGATAGVEIALTGPVVCEWISPPLSADATIAGTITLNFWSSESNMSANVAINAVIEVIRAKTTTTRDSNTLVEIARSARVTEVAVTTRAVNNFTVTPTSTVVNRGDRLRVRVFGDDVGTMASGFTFDLGYNGTSAAADGDSFVTFTETFAFEGAAAGTTIYLTDTDSTATSFSLVSSFTGADENPLSEGGTWGALIGDPVQRVSNRAAGTLTSLNTGYYIPSTYQNPAAYCTLTTFANAQGLFIKIASPGASFNGYRIRASNTATTISVMSGGSEGLAIFTDGGATTWSNGDLLGVRAIGSGSSVWLEVWQNTGAGWTRVLTGLDTGSSGSPWKAAGNIGISIFGTTSRTDDVYAGDNSVFLTPKEAWTSRGGGVVNIVADNAGGFTVGLPVQEWYTRQLTAFTLGGMAQANIRVKESVSTANLSLRGEIASVNSDGSSPTVWASWCQSANNGNTGELSTSETAETVNISGDDLAITAGQRLRFRLYLEDIPGSSMVGGATATVYYAGTSGGASGDSYITLPQSVTEFTGATLLLSQGFADHSNPGVL